MVGQSPAVTLQQGAVRRQPFPAAASFDDDLVAGVGQPVQSAAARIGSMKRLSHSPTARLLLMTDLAFLHKPVYVMTLVRSTPSIIKVQQDSYGRLTEPILCEPPPVSIRLLHCGTTPTIRGGSQTPRNAGSVYGPEVFEMTRSQLSKLSKFERGSTIVRNLAFHRTTILEPIRRIAFRNMQLLGNAMAVHPKPVDSGIYSPQAHRWIEVVQNQMLKDQGLEASTFNQWMLETNTFTPVKIYLALLYAELEYLQKQNEHYPLAQTDAIETILHNETEFIDASAAFRHSMLHPQAGGHQSETEWLDGGFLNRLPDIQQTVDLP